MKRHNQPSTILTMLYIFSFKIPFGTFQTSLTTKTIKEISTIWQHFYEYNKNLKHKRFLIYGRLGYFWYRNPQQMGSYLEWAHVASGEPSCNWPEEERRDSGPSEPIGAGFRDLPAPLHPAHLPFGAEAKRTLAPSASLPSTYHTNVDKTNKPNTTKPNTTKSNQRIQGKSTEARDIVASSMLNDRIQAEAN